MKIVYISTDYKWKEHGVTYGYYNSLVDLGHQVIYLRTADMEVCTDASVDQIWVAKSKGAFLDKQVKDIKRPIIGFNFTRFDIEPTLHHYTRVYSAGLHKGTIFLPPAVDPSFHQNIGLNRDIEHAFFGAMKGHRLLYKTLFPSMRIFSTEKGVQLINALNRVKVGMDFETMDVASTVPHRLLEYIACGVRVCCPYREDVAKMFDYGTEIIEFTGKLPRFDESIKASVARHTYLHRVKAVLMERNWNEVD